MIPEYDVSEIKRSINELPWQKRARLTSDFGLNKEEVEIYITTKWGEFFESVAELLKGEKELYKLASNYISSDLIGLAKKDGNENLEKEMRVSPEQFARLISLVKDGTISSRGAKDILAKLYDGGGNVKEIAETGGYLQQNDESLLIKIVDLVISENSKVVDEFRAGKKEAIQYLVGQSMKASKGGGNPKIFRQILEDKLQK